jgi:2TM domain
MIDENRYLKAREHVAQIKGFYAHLAVFVLVAGGLVVINLMIGRPYWAQWVLLGWGAGIGLHAGLVYLPRLGGGGRIARWEKRKIREIIERDSAAAAAPGRSPPHTAG